MSPESSIAAHLETARTIPGRTPEGFNPPYPSFSARFDPAVKQVVMAYYGVQYMGDAVPPVVSGALDELAEAARADMGPAHWDRARYVDEAGYTTILSIFYWIDLETCAAWRTAAGPSWTSPERFTADAGFFVEIVAPTVERFETLFSSDRPEGVSVPSVELSGEVLEHAYWGGARDRLPLAQTDPLQATGTPTFVRDGHLTTVIGTQNLCLIRSGQEWTETDGDERRMYLEEVEPVLRVGMEFLRDNGLEVGCYTNRYLRLLDDSDEETDKTFGMSWWRSLGDLEAWAESHPTHKAIFGAAMKYLSTTGPAARLRLYHEVTVAAPAQLEFAYLGCHDRTGLLRIHAS